VSAKSTIAMVVLLVVLIGVYAIWGVGERVFERRTEEAKRVFDFEAADVENLLIEQDGAKPVSGSRDAESWSIVRPEGIPSNPLVWDRIADSFAALKSERTINENPSDVSEYELDPPLLSIDASLTDGRSLRFAAGAMDPFQVHHYARVDDGPVFLITKDAFFELNRSLLWLRDRDLVTAGEDGIRRVEFLRYAQSDSENVKRGQPSKVVAAERSEVDGRWMLTDPVEGVADQAMVDALVQEVRFGKGRGYIDNPEDLDDYGLEVPGAGLTVYPFGGEPQTIYFGNFAGPNNEKSEAFVQQKGRKAVFLASAHIISQFPKSPEAYLEKRILPHPGSEMKAIDFAWGNTDIRLERDDRNRWNIVRPIQDRADDAAVSQFVSSLVSIVGAGYLANNADVFGFSDPGLLVRIELEDTEDPVEIRVGLQTQERDRFLVLQASGSVTTVLKEEIDELMLDLFYFRNKRLFAFQPNKVAKVTMQFRGEAYAFEVSGGRWAVREPEGFVWETQSDMELLLSTIADARYEAIEADSAPDDLTPFGLDEPTLEFTATVTQSDPNTPILEAGPFRIGNPAEDDSQSRFATMAGRPELFRVPQSLIDGIEEARRGLVEK
jgi:hypothetical protein